MNSSFTIDLHCARRKSGLTQGDLAHLLGCSKAKISRLESGGTQPGLRDICMLSYVYGKSFESLFGALFADIRHNLGERLTTLPGPREQYLGTFNRKNTLDALADRLAGEIDHQHGG